MADQLINMAKSFLIAELTKQIKENEKNFNIVENGIDTLFIELKAKLEPISKPLIAGITLISFGDPNKRLKELTEELKLKIDGIDFSELEKIPNILPELKKRIKALTEKVKSKLKNLIDELVTGSSAATTAATTAETTVPAEGPAATTPEGPAIIDTKAESIKEAIDTMNPDTKKEAIDNIMKYLNSTGMLEEIKLLICAPVIPVLPPAPPAVGGGKQNRRRKTKKNIYHRSRGRTQYGRKF